MDIVDEQWVAFTHTIKRALNDIKKTMDFHQTRVSFEKVLQDYIKYRAQLEDEVTSIINFWQILEHVKSAEILDLLKDRLNKIPNLIL